LIVYTRGRTGDSPDGYEPLLPLTDVKEIFMFSTITRRKPMTTMNRTNSHWLTLACAILCSNASAIWAQENRAQETRPQERTETRASQPAAKVPMIRASTLIGQNLINSQNQDVGSVHDVVLDGQTGRVRYVVVTYGGFLGIGNKLFAVPYEALRWSTNPAHDNRHQILLDVTQEQLEGAVGFDNDNWPDFHDPQFQADLNRRYRLSQQQLQNQQPQNQQPRAQQPGGAGDPDRPIRN
jgi:sporulation protein YlmC with PRC-barrel domain